MLPFFCKQTNLHLMFLGLTPVINKTHIKRIPFNNVTLNSINSLSFIDTFFYGIVQCLKIRSQPLIYPSPFWLVCTTVSSKTIIPLKPKIILLFGIISVLIHPTFALQLLSNLFILHLFSNFTIHVTHVHLSWSSIDISFTFMYIP